MTGAFWIAWHVLSAAAVFLVPTQFSNDAVWSVPKANVVFAFSLALTYLTCAGALSARRSRVASAMRRRSWMPLAIVCAYLLYLLVAKSFYSRAVLVVGLALSVLFIALSFVIPRAWQRMAVACLGGAVSATLLAGLVDNAETRASRPSVTQQRITTSLYTVLATKYRGYFGLGELTTPDGGGLVPFRDGLILATGDGGLYVVALHADGPVVSTLPYRVPMNSADFVRDAPKDVETKRFRTASLAIQETNGRLRLVTSHHFWHAEQHCFTLRVSSLELLASSVAVADEHAEWRTIYETTPCLGFDTRERFTGNQAGGKLLFLDEGHLLVTVGDHGFDGVNSANALPQDTTTSYGKTMLVDVDSGESQLYTLGHRNPQGLYLAPDGVIWETEQGPRGGDELNLITRGANYGWPLATYGTNYKHLTWPLNRVQGEHAGYTLPVYAWVPSIVVSSLTGMEIGPGAEGGPFALWKHDLLAASLVDEALWRIRVREGRVVFAERMYVGERIRDVVCLRDGRIALWTDNRSIEILEPDTASGHHE